MPEHDALAASERDAEAQADVGAADVGETTLTVRLRRGSEPISGVLASGEDQREFRGWIELAGLIEGLRAGA